MIKERSDHKNAVETMNSEISQDEEEQKMEKMQEDSSFKAEYH